MSIVGIIARELGVREAQVQAVVELINDGATVPFIARYRKEATGGLDDAQLRLLEDRLNYLTELEERRQTVLKSIREQDKLSPALEKAINEADTKTRLEDLYRPYMPKRRTKAQIAREAGLQPLAERLLQDPTVSPQQLAKQYINADKNVADESAALEGARHILAEQFAEDAQLLEELRNYAWKFGKLQAKLVSGKEAEGAKFKDYFDYSESIHKIPSHRALAIMRGQKEGVLTVSMSLDEQEPDAPQQAGVGEQKIAQHFDIQDAGRAADSWLLETVRWCWRIKLLLHLDLEMKKRVRELAEEEAIKVFARNLKDLLLAAPAGQRATLGLDPGIRTGVKVAVVDNTGKLVDTATIYPHAPKHQWDQSIAVLAALARKHQVELVSIGNGTASRETDKLAQELMQRYPELGLSKIVVSEAGASVYSASDFASREFPKVDVSLRGAISIARRLQDPLAELVKIEPKSIGVGQYQHDVNQVRLGKMLTNVVEDCVNAVGVDVNTASIPLLSQVSGLNSGLAEKIVAYRDENGAFSDRKELLKVPRLGPKAFEQAAGFLRIMNGNNPLDASAVHPEAYPVVQRIMDTTGKDIRSLIGDSKFLQSLSANEYADEQFGVPTVKDILSELDKPGRDPRPEFQTVTFAEGVETLNDLQPGMKLDGVVTNVTNFGAFVDIGVHQDGLVHISMLADKYVDDPHKVVKAGDIVRVSVLDVDVKRKRVALSMRSAEPGNKKENAATDKTTDSTSAKKAKNNRAAKPQTAMANAFSKLQQLHKD